MSFDASIEAYNVSVLFPLYHGHSRSLKKMLVRAASGRLAEDQQHRVVVRALSNISFSTQGDESKIPDCFNKSCTGKQPLTCDPCMTDCGATNPGFGYASITIGPGTASSCPNANGQGFGDTVFHETLHVCGLASEPHWCGPQASFFRYAEKTCFGWRSPLAPPRGAPCR